jgi:prolipoprotein diacylglyceryltransferase
MYIIDPSTGPAHSVFIGAGVFAALVYAVAFARARGTGCAEALVLLGACSAAGIVGALLVGALFEGTLFHGALSGRGSSIGVLAGASLAALGLTLVMAREQWLKSLDVVVPAGLLALGWAHLGCLFRGCDFGRVADLPWAVGYAAGSGPWAWHFLHGLIAPGSETSLGTHAFGLYLGLSTIIVVIVVSIFASMARERASGEVAVFAALGYLGLRMFVEFFREPVRLPTLEPGFHVLHPVLLVAFVAVVIFWYRGVRLDRCPEDRSSK